METPVETRKAKEESEIGATVAVATFADLVASVALAGKRFVVTTHGKPRAAIVGMDDLERLRALDAA